MRRTYKFLLRPTAGQERSIERMFRCHCDLYNAALQERREAWSRSSITVRLRDQRPDLPWIRANVEGFNEWSAWSQQQVLRRLDQAFEAFFRRVAAGQTPGFPRFKSHSRWKHAEFLPGNGAKWIPDSKRIHFMGVGHVKVHAHRRVEGRIKTITIVRQGRRWFALLSCDDVPQKLLAPTGRWLGVDLGVTHFLTDSEGNHVSNPRHLGRAEQRLADAQRAFAASGRRSRKRRERIGDLSRKVARQRRDFHHKLARALVQTTDVLVIEDLNIAGLRRRPAPLPSPDVDGAFLPNGATTKRGLNKSIADVAWASFITLLREKAEEAGRSIGVVDPRFTSQTHHLCGTKGERHGERFHCVTCDVDEHADHNAAINILRRGLAPPPRREAPVTGEGATVGMEIQLLRLSS